MNERIEHAARRAAALTRQEYEAEGLHTTVMCYDLARDAARDRDYKCCINIDVDPRPTNVGAALLRMFDDMRALAGHPRVHQESYRPQVIVN